ncbi:MAG: hypothetical protein AAFV25_24905, partial [Bacteroidota bacterium]
VVELLSSHHKGGCIRLFEIFSKMRSTATLVPEMTGFPYILFGFDSMYFRQSFIFFFKGKS